jgi:hypothetical protein
VNRPVFTGAQDDVTSRRGHDRVVKVSKHVATGPVTTSSTAARVIIRSDPP